MPTDQPTSTPSDLDRLLGTNSPAPVVPQHQRIARDIVTLAIEHVQAGELTLAEKSLAYARELVAHGHLWDTYIAVDLLTQELYLAVLLGRKMYALPQARQAAEIAARVLAPTNPWRTLTKLNYADVLLEIHQPAAAQEVLCQAEESLRLYKSAAGQEDDESQWDTRLNKRLSELLTQAETAAHRRAPQTSVV